MPASIGVNLRVTGHCRQGGRKYMEDFFSVAYQQTEDEKDLEYAFFGIYDGHGGAEAAAFAKEHLMESIVKHKSFWSEDDEDVLRSIKDGFIATHYAMWRTHDKWPKTSSGLPSTAGTTASVAFMRRGKIYIGHVGDSGIALGYQESGCPDWRAKALTKDHKPESEVEMARIEQSGGKVISKSGVPRVVWNRPRIGHKGPVRRSTPIDDIPFLAVARSLGDLWSYNSALNEFVVSPTPDVSVIPINTETFRCLIFGTDGLYNMLSPHMAVHIVQQAEKHNEQAALSGQQLNRVWINPSKYLVEKALERWNNTKMRADNTSVITLMLDPPGPPRAEVLRNKRNSAYTSSGLQIETRYQEAALNTAESVAECTTELQQIESDLERIETKWRSFAEYDRQFAPNARESTQPNAETKYSQHSPPTNVPHNPKNASITRNILMSPRNDAATDETKSFKIGINNSKYDAGASCSSTPPPLDSDIQINEISSSSVCVEQIQNENAEKPSPKIKEKIAAKRSLRSSDKDVVNISGGGGVRADLGGSTVIPGTSKKKKRRLAEEKYAKRFKPNEKNENQCCVSAKIADDTKSVENRVLRERKNPQTNVIHKKLKKKITTLSLEKKKLLQNILFRNKAPKSGADVSSSTMKQKSGQKNEERCLNTTSPTKTHNRRTWTQNYTKVTPTKSEVIAESNNNGRILRNSPMKQQRVDSTSRDVKIERAVRKSTLAQKFRRHQDTFKAKLRVRSPAALKLKKQKKTLSLKKTKKS